LFLIKSLEDSKRLIIQRRIVLPLSERKLHIAVIDEEQANK